MEGKPIITSVEVYEFEYELKNMGTDYNGFNKVYEPGGNLRQVSYILRINTNLGLSGECVGSGVAEISTLPMFVRYLIGKNALERDLIYTEVKRALRAMARIGIAPMDICLWDIAGKYYDAPVYELLGGRQKKLPCYASTYHGDTNGGLDSPQKYADFADQCLDMGYPAFKIHGWGNAPIEQEAATVHAVGKKVGDKMDLMLDPACEYETFADAIKVGRACDEEGFLWLEDPFKDGGISQFAHRKLRQLIKTPLLQTEHVRSLEPHVDFILADATDFVRGDVLFDGITGVMKLAHAAEGLGVDIEFHGPGPAQRHCMASIRNTNYYEMALVHPKGPRHVSAETYTNYRDGLDAIDEKGCVDVPGGPGLGVEINWDYIKSHQTGRVEYK